MNRAKAAAARAPAQGSGVWTWIFSTSPWLWASMLAVALACTVDLVVIRPEPRASAVALLAGLALFIGLLHGVAVSVLWVFVGKLPGRWRDGFWPVAGAAAGFWVAWALGTLTRLQGRYWKFAAGVLAVTTLGGLAFGLVCAAFQPRAGRVPYLLGQTTPVRSIAAIALVAIASTLWWVDREYFVGQYLHAHLALRACSLWCVMMALVAAARVVPLPRVRAWGWLLLCAGFGACLLAPNPRRLLPSLATRPWPGLLLQLSQQLTDWDRDGYSQFLGGGDCAPWNRSVHPGAREVPDNGIDDNCLLGDAGRKVDDLTELPIPSTPSPMDVVLITVDSLRPDHLGTYAPRRYGPTGRNTAPNIDRFARDATVFERAYTTGAWTSMAVPSLLRGVYPRRLQWKKWFETTFFQVLRKPLLPKLRPGEAIMRMFPLAFDDRHPSIASLLRRRGMHTAAVADDGHSEMLQPSTGLDQGFVSFREVDSLSAGRNNDAGTTDLAISALRRLPAGKRFFLWVHYFGIHWPDDEHKGVPKYGSEQVDMYDHEIAFFDQECGRLLDALARRPDPVAVFITADHGEGLVSGIRQHGLTLDEAVIKVPLIAKVPGWPVLRTRQLATTIDLVPTILALTQTPAPSYLDGIDLSGVLTSETRKARVVFSDTWRFDGFERLEINFSAAYDGVNKVLLDRMNGGVYELEQRREVRPRDAAENPAFKSLTQALFGYLEETGGALDLSE